MKNKFPQIVYVYWLDAAHGLSEAPKSDLDLVELHEIGWLIKETPEAITLSMEHMHGSDENRLWLSIPRVNIVEMRRLGFPRKVFYKRKDDK